MADKKTFEKSMSELEGLVRQLESGNITLDDSLGAFENGIKLTRECDTLLNEAKGKVEKLIKDSTGTMVAEQFEAKE